jgi:phosphorylcholine metabolism protein LicD
LFGAVRDEEILEWDNDIDLGMGSNYGKKLLLAINELERRKVALRMGYIHFSSERKTSENYRSEMIHICGAFRERVGTSIKHPLVEDLSISILYPQS